MNIDELFKSAFLKAAALHGKPKKLTIMSVEKEEVGDEEKAVMRFNECDQALILNKTNASTLAEAFGKESDNWVGHEVVLKPEKTDFQGKRVDCIRLHVPPPPKAAAGGNDVNV